MLAVLISGSWRTGSTVAEHNYSVLKKSGRPFKIFIHTWKENIATFRTPLETVYAHHWYFSLSEPVYDFILPIVDLDGLQESYPGAIVKIETFDKFFFYNKHSFSNIQKTIPRYLNTCAMYYGMDQSRKLLMSDPAFPDFQYFLKLRPDFLISEAALEAVFRSPLIFIGQTIENDKGRVSDQCFGGEISKSFQAMGAVDRLAPVLQESGYVFPEEVAITGENPLIEHISNLRMTSNFDINFLSESPPYDMIQRPKIINNPDKSYFAWASVCFRHNLNVFLNRASGYSKIMSFKVRKLPGRLARLFSN